MKAFHRHIIFMLALLLCCAMPARADEWIPHFAYNDITTLTVTPDEIYVLSGGHIFSINKQTEALYFYTNQDGLTGSNVSHMTYDSGRKALLLFYEDGSLDVKSADGVTTVSDLYLKQMTAGKGVNCSLQDGDMLYLGMPYGVQTYQMADRKFVDTYYIGDEAGEVDVTSMTLIGRTLYAADDSLVYYASLDATSGGPVDFRQWTALPWQQGKQVRGLANMKGSPVALWDETLYTVSNGQWQPFRQNLRISRLLESNGRALAISADGGIYDLSVSSSSTPLCEAITAVTSAYDKRMGDYWLADASGNVTHYSSAETRSYSVNSPIMNMPYRMDYTKDKLFVVPGARWALQSNRPGYIMMLQGGVWTNVTYDRLNGQLTVPARDLMSVAADSTDLDHYFVASYGMGIYEMRHDTIVNHYLATNSGLADASEADPEHYTRVDGLQFDPEGNLWMANSSVGIQVMRPDRTWIQLRFTDIQGKTVEYSTPDRPIRDPLNPNRVWLATCRNLAGLGLYDFGGTLADKTDDRTLYRSQFTDQDGATREFEYLYGSAADLDGNIWLCTSAGLWYVPATEDFFTSSLILHPGVMAGDADYLLKDEKVNCITVDRSNRKWIGTDRLGVYVLSADNRTVEAHYTTQNSAMPANSVLSLAISPYSGVVMIGTASGLVEYRPTGSALSEDDYEALETPDYSGMTGGWTFHYAYGGVSEVAYSSGLVYGLADGAIYSVDTQDETVTALNALSGLSGSGIGHIAGDGNGRLLVAYTDGNFDIIGADGTISNMTDLKRKQLSGVSKLMHDVVFDKGKGYMAMDFGVLVVNPQKNEISDWYLPTEGDYPYLQHVLVEGDSIYAASATTVYSAALKDNLVDYAFWKTQPLAERADLSFYSHFCSSLTAGGCTYQAAGKEGITRTCNGETTHYLPGGPALNKPYRMTFQGDKMVMVPGGRWTTQNQQNAYVMIYEDGEWHNIDEATIRDEADRPYVMDFTRAAIDPQDPNHYFISSYGFGLYEFQNDHIKNIYMPDNSPLTSAAPPDPEYTRVDGVTFDSEENVWMLNSSSTKALHVLSPSGQWASMQVNNNGNVLQIPTPGDVLIDMNTPNYKWLMSGRNPAGVALYDDRETPFVTSDDRSVFRSTFVDGNGKTITPDQVRCLAQDRNGLLWVGTKEGVFYISPSTDFFTSNRVGRVIINRTDGSSLGDYMLGTEQINGIAVDGGNRLWFATASSGAYLMDLDLVNNDHQTVYHFTTANSPLPSDDVLSVAIQPSTGEVFFGTEMGLVSFRSDASEPAEDYTSAYVYPNPVRPDFGGMLTVTGLTEESSVKITDAAGNLVYTCTSNGGTAVWNMKGVDGSRVRPGVYLIFCNSSASEEDSKHKAIKVLIM